MDVVKIFAKNVFGFVKSITLFAIIATIVDVLGVQLLNNYDPQKFLVAIFVGYSLTHLLIAVGTILPQTIAFKNNDAAIWIAKLLQLFAPFVAITILYRSGIEFTTSGAILFALTIIFSRWNTLKKELGEFSKEGK